MFANFHTLYLKIDKFLEPDEIIFWGIVLLDYRLGILYLGFILGKKHNLGLGMGPNIGPKSGVKKALEIQVCSNHDPGL